MADFGQNSDLVLSQRQTTQLSQKQRTSLELLHLPLADLETRLTEEFAVNPALEESAPEETEALPDDAAKCDGEDFDGDEEEERGELASSDEWADELPLPPEFTAGGAEAELLGNAPAPGPSLRELLLTELEASNCPETLHAPAVEIISALDDDGFLRTNLADLAMACDAALEDMEAALALVQQIAPPGIAARSLGESLKLQLQRRGELTPLLTKLLDTGLEDVEKNRIPALLRKLEITSETLSALLAKLRTLDPAPGRRFQHGGAKVVRPELLIDKDEEGRYRVTPLREQFRRVIVSPLYEKMAEKSGLAPEEKKYLNEKLTRARELVKSLSMRDSTLKRLGEVIVARQRDFLEHGPAALRPMTMREAGTMLELSESTISRAAEEKFVQTPHGIFPLRSFFSSGYASAGEAGELSNRAVMEKIRDLIGSEDPRRPLSDDKIASQLAQEGLNVARRTVAKYRDLLKIPSSSLRKQHL